MTEEFSTFQAWTPEELWHEMTIPHKVSEYTTSGGGFRTFQDGREFHKTGGLFLDHGAITVYTAYDEHYRKGGYNICLEITDGVGGQDIMFKDYAPGFFEFLNRYAGLFQSLRDHEVHFTKLDV